MLIQRFSGFFAVEKLKRISSSPSLMGKLSRPIIPNRNSIVASHSVDVNDLHHARTNRAQEPVLKHIQLEARQSVSNRKMIVICLRIICYCCSINMLLVVAMLAKIPPHQRRRRMRLKLIKTSFAAARNRAQRNAYRRGVC